MMRIGTMMESARVDFPEVVGKSVAELTVLDDPEFGREILVRFTDATQLSISVGVKQTVDARYCNEDTPDKPFFIRQD